MVTLNRITTRSGDAGETGMADGSRVPKTHPRVIAIGAVDETNATLGLVRLEAPEEVDLVLARVQNDVFDLGADLATPGVGPGLRVTKAQVEAIEADAARFNDRLPPLTSFVLPSGSRLSTYLHVARTVCRRAEIACWALAAAEPVSAEVTTYLNRLSDLLFILARVGNRDGAADVLWKPGGG